MTSSVGEEAAAAEAHGFKKNSYVWRQGESLEAVRSLFFRTKRRNYGGWGLELGDPSERLSTSTRKQATNCLNSGGNVFKWFKKGFIR